MMARAKNEADKTSISRTTEKQDDELIPCGIIMPISATVSHSESYWDDVQKLLHRGIKAAGFEPKNVWESSSTDRISERIVGNIFNYPIVIADISDLNPNVMLELGLRLSSKKPTIVLAGAGGTIPFDIRDFEAIFYPSDLNILEMEIFFSKLSKALSEKYKHHNDETYVPFLSTVIVDVASPETREVGLNDLILSRLEDISRRVAAMEPKTGFSPYTSENQWKNNRISRSEGFVYVDIPEQNRVDFEFLVHSVSEVDKVQLVGTNQGMTELKVHFSGAENHQLTVEKILQTARELGGDEGMPF